MTKERAEGTKSAMLSPFDDYNNWKTRKALGVKINGAWYYSLHMGWWGDKESPFEYEYNSLKNSLPKNEDVWLMGDFNSVAGRKNEGYDLVIKSGFYDTYCMAEIKDGGVTASTSIDGWKTGNGEKIRIDYIFTSANTKIKSHITIFTGENEEKISDHFGILLCQ